MALINDQKLQFMNDMRSLSDLYSLIREKSRELAQKWSSLAFAASAANEFVDGDMTGTIYDGFTAAELTACVTSILAYETWIDAGHDDNLQKIRQ